MLYRFRFPAIAVLVLAAQPARAVSDAEFQALQARLLQLDAEVRELKRERAHDRALPRTNRADRAVERANRQAADEPPRAAHTIGQSRSPSNVAYPSSPPSLTARVAALEGRMRIADERSPFPVLVGYRPGKGVTFVSPNDEFQVRIGGYIQADNRSFIGNGKLQATIPDQFLVRSARLIMESRLFNNFSTRLMYDFGGTAPQLLDAYADYNATPAFNVRAGKAKDPLGIERLQAETNVSFVERGMTTNLVPYRDIGVQVYGTPIPQLDYQFGLVDGGPDLVNITGASDNPRTGVGRVFTHPFVSTDISWLKGLSVGIAGSYGRHSGTASANDLTSGYVTPAQAKFFSFASTTYGDGQNTRFNPELTYYYGPFSVISEYVREYQDVSNGTTRANLKNDAWMVTSTFVVTGEDARFDGVVPRKNFDPFAGTWGAVEIAGRYSQLNVDKGTFPLFASANSSANQAQETTVGANWYLNPAVKLQLDFTMTRFKGGAANNGDRATEKAILTRAQVVF